MNTTLEATGACREKDLHHHNHRCDTVEIHVNNDKVTLQPGRYDVATFKKVAGIPQADELEELVNCKLKPVAEDATIHIQGCEVFISHVRDGGAS